MEIKILSENDNPLLRRKEVVFQVEHEQTGRTPRRSEVKDAIARALRKDADLVFVKKVETKTGTCMAIGTANIYDSVECAKLIEPEYIIKRNTSVEKEKEESEK